MAIEIDITWLPRRLIRVLETVQDPDLVRLNRPSAMTLEIIKLVALA